MSLGFGQIIIILVVIFLIFGASRLPRIAEDLAKGMKAFKKGLADDEGMPDGDGPAPSHLTRAKPALIAAPTKRVIKSAAPTKQPATKAVTLKTAASQTAASRSSAALKPTKTGGVKKTPNKKSPSKK